LDFRFAGFEIDIPRRELRGAGELVSIEPQVFDLLVHLVRNHDRIVTKDELIEAVWKGRAISEAALSSRISAARRAVGDSGAEQKLIRTLNKRGFRFVGAVQAAGKTTVPVAQRASCGKAEASVFTWSDRASIAVLPFQNISGDPEQECLADGMTEDITTGLSRQQWFSVVDRNSSFARKGEAVDIRKLACELGARYVLEGSVRKAGGRIRITAQLIDATKRIHVWADRHDSAVSDIFVRQDEITNRIVDSVRSQLVMAEAMRLRGRPSVDVDAYHLVTQALPHMWRMSVSEQLLEVRAVERGERAGRDVGEFARIEIEAIKDYKLAVDIQLSIDAQDVCAAFGTQPRGPRTAALGAGAGQRLRIKREECRLAVRAAAEAQVQRRVDSAAAV